MARRDEFEKVGQAKVGAKFECKLANMDDSRIHRLPIVNISRFVNYLLNSRNFEQILQSGRIDRPSRLYHLFDAVWEANFFSLHVKFLILTPSLQEEKHHALVAILLVEIVFEATWLTISDNVTRIQQLLLFGLFLIWLGSIPVIALLLQLLVRPRQMLVHRCRKFKCVHFFIRIKPIFLNKYRLRTNIASTNYTIYTSWTLMTIIICSVENWIFIVGPDNFKFFLNNVRSIHFAPNQQLFQIPHKFTILVLKLLRSSDHFA